MRLALASCLQRLPVGERPLLATALVRRAEDADDHNLPLLVWYALIPLVEADPTQAAEVAVVARWPETQRMIARRLAGLIDRAPTAVARIVSAVQRGLLAGLADGLAGRRRVAKPAGWDEAVAAVAGDPEAAARARDLSILFGDGRAVASPSPPPTHGGGSTPSAAGSGPTCWLRPIAAAADGSMSNHAAAAIASSAWGRRSGPISRAASGCTSTTCSKTSSTRVSW